MTLAKPYRDHKRKPEPEQARLDLPLSPEHYAESVQHVTDVEQARTICRLFDERPINRVGIDFEFRYDRPPIEHHGKKIDFVRTIRPLLLALSPVERCDDGTERVYRIVVDVRDPDVTRAIEPVFHLPVPFVAHYAKVELFCLWRLALPVPSYPWDPFIAERAMRLGLNRGGRTGGDASTEEIEAKAEAERQRAASLRLVEVGARYGVRHRLASGKQHLQQSFLEHSDGQPFTQEQIEYAAEDAVVAAAIYPRQVLAAAGCGVLDHLKSIEMPWVRVVAGMCWEGVAIDQELVRRTLRDVPARLQAIDRELHSLGLDNYRSHPQMLAYFEHRGHLEAFRKGKKYTFAKETLRDVEHLDPAVPLMLEAKRLQSAMGELELMLRLVDTDNRVHADHRQLGTDSGRQTSRHPNLLGLPSLVRPTIVAPAGRAIGEVDLSQIEVGITAAVYREPDLMAMFNAGDVYCAMAKTFFAAELTPEDTQLDDGEFKRQHKGKRDLVKTCTLGIIYGLTAYGLAPRLGVDEAEAQRQLDAFMDLFPALRLRLTDEVKHARRRGYAWSGTGLRRLVGEPGQSDRRLNWARNHPVQATAGSLFKAAGIRLDRLYRAHDARLILPVHDAFVFECPTDRLQDVAELTRRVLIEAVQERYPDLRPRAELNIDRPECWTKDGNADSLEQLVREVEQTDCVFGEEVSSA